MSREDTAILFQEFNDLENYEGHTEQLKEEQPERYIFELDRFTDSHATISPVFFNLKTTTI